MPWGFGIFVTPFLSITKLSAYEATCHRFVEFSVSSEVALAGTDQVTSRAFCGLWDACTLLAF